MTIILKLLRSPLVRIIGAITILYYALFANTYEKDSLGNRLSKKTIEKNLEETKRKSLYIAVNIKKAQDYKKNKISGNSPSNTTSENQNPNLPNNFSISLIIKDIQIGQGKEAKCGDKITANYIIYDNEGNKLDSITNYTVRIDENSVKSIVKENLIGLKAGSKRLIILPVTYKTKDGESFKYMALSHNKGINYEINLIKVEEAKNTAAKCNWSNENTILLH